MSDKGFTSYRIGDQNGLYYLTFATVGWVDIFTRKYYRDIVVESLQYCQKEKGLVLYAWCIMSNHIHLIARAEEGFKLSDILRDFKKHTSKEIAKAIENNHTKGGELNKESRREWLLELLAKAGASNKKNETYQLWRNDNHPIELFKDHAANQKLAYIHNNPVSAGIVDKAEEYIYSSARDYYKGEHCGLIKIEYL